MNVGYVNTEPKSGNIGYVNTEPNPVAQRNSYDFPTNQINSEAKKSLPDNGGWVRNASNATTRTIVSASSMDVRDEVQLPRPRTLTPSVNNVESGKPDRPSADDPEAAPRFSKKLLLILIGIAVALAFCLIILLLIIFVF